MVDIVTLFSGSMRKFEILSFGLAYLSLPFPPLFKVLICVVYTENRSSGFTRSFNACFFFFGLEGCGLAYRLVTFEDFVFQGVICVV